MNNVNEPIDGSPLPLLAAADLQDHLMTATNDLDRDKHCLLNRATRCCKPFMALTPRCKR